MSFHTFHGSGGPFHSDISSSNAPQADEWLSLAQQYYDPNFSFDIMDGLNDNRTRRVGELLDDFRNLQYWIAAGPNEPPNEEDSYTEGWVLLRQCAHDGVHILECAADTSVPEAAGEEEQKKAELKQILLDSFARRHEGQKIYSKQQAAIRWVELREHILQGGRPSRRLQSQLQACDQRLQSEVASITDERVYVDLVSSDQAMGRWTAEDPSLRSVQRWLRHRRP